MGLFSFLKNAGAKIFNRNKKEETAAAVPAEKIELTKIEALQQEISRLGIPVNGLELELSEQVTVKGQTATNADREKVILALGNVEGVGVVDDRIDVANPEPEAVFYTVEKGDSLSKIAKAHYGDPMKYNHIFEANRPMLEHPDKIYPGQMLRIPPVA
ncbi:MAG: peptidoglycan-binding protein LysM [Bacteroidota bacterium]